MSFAVLTFLLTEGFALKLFGGSPGDRQNGFLHFRYLLVDFDARTPIENVGAKTQKDTMDSTQFRDGVLAVLLFMVLETIKHHLCAKSNRLMLSQEIKKVVRLDSMSCMSFLERILQIHPPLFFLGLIQRRKRPKKDYESYGYFISNIHWRSASLTGRPWCPILFGASPAGTDITYFIENTRIPPSKHRRSERGSKAKNWNVGGQPVATTFYCA